MNESNFSGTVTKEEYYKELYNLAAPDKFMSMVSINKLLDKIKEHNSICSDKKCADFPLKDMYVKMIISNCFSQLKLLDKFISEINIHKKLTAFDERQLEVYMSKVAEIEKVLNTVEPEISIMGIITRGV